MFKMDNKIKQPSGTALVKITPNNQVKTLELEINRQQQPNQPQNLSHSNNFLVSCFDKQRN